MLSSPRGYYWIGERTLLRFCECSFEVYHVNATVRAFNGCIARVGNISVRGGPGKDDPNNITNLKRRDSKDGGQDNSKGAVAGRELIVEAIAAVAMLVGIRM